MKKKALFTIKQGSWLEALLLPLFFMPMFIMIHQFILGGVLYAIVSFLYRTFYFRYARITGKSIVGFVYAKPYRKTCSYFYEDIVQVYIPLPGRSGWQMDFMFRGGVSFSSKVPDHIEHICRHFIDKRIPVETGSSYIRNMIIRYSARPQTDPYKQIALRKAREAERKKKLNRLRGK